MILSIFSIFISGFSIFIFVIFKLSSSLIFKSLGLFKYDGISASFIIYSEGFNKFLLFKIICWLIFSSKIDFNVGGIFFVPGIVPSIIISELWIKSFPFLIFGFLYPFVFPYSITFFIFDVPIILPVILSYILVSFSLFNLLSFSLLSFKLLFKLFKFSASFSFKEIFIFLSFSIGAREALPKLIFWFNPGISPSIISSLKL